MVRLQWNSPKAAGPNVLRPSLSGMVATVAPMEIRTYQCDYQRV